jgi:hypothetical protein
VKPSNEAFVVLAIKLGPNGIGVHTSWDFGKDCLGEVSHWLVLFPPSIKSDSCRNNLGVCQAKMLIISHVGRVSDYEFDA